MSTQKTAEIEFVTDIRDNITFILRCYDFNQTVVNTEIYKSFLEAEKAYRDWCFLT